MPPILLCGRVVGKLKKKDSKLSLTLFESLGLRDKVLIRDIAENLWGGLKNIVFDGEGYL